MLLAILAMLVLYEEPIGSSKLFIIPSREIMAQPTHLT
eukprot:SAG11_NODE_11443_length_760_cov_1.298033_3_plen_37_part_01